MSSTQPQVTQEVKSQPMCQAPNLELLKKIAKLASMLGFQPQITI